MIKKIIFIVALSFSLQWVAAQTVSDDQVVKMIMAEKEHGANETDIARKLLQKGVTPAQLRRIKDKYEKENDGLGAVDLTGKEEKSNRLRNNKEKDEEGNLVENRYYQYVTVNNATITPNSKVDLQPKPEDLVIFHEKDLAFTAVNAGGQVRICAIGQKPTAQYTLSATVTEVV